MPVCLCAIPGRSELFVYCRLHKKVLGLSCMLSMLLSLVMCMLQTVRSILAFWHDAKTGGWRDGHAGNAGHEIRAVHAAKATCKTQDIPLS